MTSLLSGASDPALDIGDQRYRIDLGRLGETLGGTPREAREGFRARGYRNMSLEPFELLHGLGVVGRKRRFDEDADQELQARDLGKELLGDEIVDFLLHGHSPLGLSVSIADRGRE